MNSLQDVEIIDALYRAADAGVDIELNVRGICCLKTGPPANGKVIRVVSIVDRYLEHARIFFFHHGGNHQLFIASADWMTRNLDKRVELMVPVTNGKLARPPEIHSGRLLQGQCPGLQYSAGRHFRTCRPEKRPESLPFAAVPDQGGAPPGQGQGTGTPADAGTAHTALKALVMGV